MREQATRAWTEFRPRFTLAVVTVLSAGVLVGVETGWGRSVLALVFLVALWASVTRDGYVGVVIGLAGAAAVVLFKRLSGDFVTRDFSVIGAEVVTLIVAPWVVGILGQHLRTTFAHLEKPVVGTVSPVSNALGVLGMDVGMFRLDEELDRRRRTGEPLVLAVIRAVPLAYVSGGDDEEANDEALRAVTRNVESVTRDVDVVFALDQRTLAVIMPATDATEGAEAVGRMVLAASAATFSSATDRTRLVVSQRMALRTTLLETTDDTQRAAGLMESALELLAGGIVQSHRSA